MASSTKTATNKRRTIALVGFGNLAKYICEEILADDKFELVVISRQKSILWLEERSITHLTGDYTKDSILSILDSTNATALISFLNPPTALYVPLHTALLQACLASSKCKRFIPSEWCGNIDDFPLLPSFYGTSREPFRQLLVKETAPVVKEGGKKTVDWTLLNNGWLMDYFLTEGKTWMPAIPDEFPVDPNGWGVCVRGTGDEPQSFTSARDIGKAVVELLAWEGEWELNTYVAGDWLTFNEAIKLMETFYDRPMPKTFKSAQEIEGFITEHADRGEEDRHEMIIARVEQWMIAGATALPKEKTLRQREKYFGKVKFSTLQELLVRAKDMDGVV